MKISDIISYFEMQYPKESALEGDKVGYMIHKTDTECTGVLLTVDVTDAALEEAFNFNCNLIISHHPLIFNPITEFTPYQCAAEVIAKAYLNGITVYSAHTNVDCSKNNMSVRALKAIGATDVDNFLPNGLGAIGNIKATTLKNIKQKFANLFEDNRTFSLGDENAVIKRICEINGGGADSEALKAAKYSGADVFISADIKHHVMLEAKAISLPLISVGHYASEKCFNDIVYDILHCHFDTLNIIKFFDGNPYN